MRVSLIITVLITCWVSNAIAHEESTENVPPDSTRIVSLKHREASPSHAYVHEHADPPHPLDHSHIHDDPNLNHKASRSGISLQKSPPDLQFGLAFTVPFVSLSTDKLLNGVSGKNFDGVSSLLKLNFSGLLLAAVVGLVAAAAIFLPSFFPPGGSHTPWLDNIIPHFSDQQYNDYENGWGGKPGGAWGKDFSARRSRAFDTVSGIGFNLVRWMDKFKTGVGKIEKCAVKRVCDEKKQGNGKGKVSELLTRMTEKGNFNDVGIVKVISNVVNGDLAICEKLKDLDCEAFKDIENTLLDIVGAGEEKQQDNKT